jgi:bacterioferritin-associated ferredoxin
MYVCVCRAVTDREVRKAIESGAHTLKDLRHLLGITRECGRCTDCVRQLLKKNHDARGAH